MCLVTRVQWLKPTRWKERTNFRATLQPLHVFCDVPRSTHNNKLFKKQTQSQNPKRKAQTVTAEVVTGFWPMRSFTGAFNAFDKDGDGIIKLNVLEVSVTNSTSSAPHNPRWSERGPCVRLTPRQELERGPSGSWGVCTTRPLSPKLHFQKKLS